MFRASLEMILEGCPGALAGVVMGFDGVLIEVVAAEGAIDVTAVSTEFSFVLNEIRKAAEVLDVGELREVVIRSERLILMVSLLSAECFLAVALDPGGNFGKGRFLMRLAQKELQDRMSHARRQLP